MINKEQIILQKFKENAVNLGRFFKNLIAKFPVCAGPCFTPLMSLFPTAEGEKSVCSGGVELLSTAILCCFVTSWYLFSVYADFFICVVSL